MTISEFTDTFIPHLIQGYVRGELQLFSLFDFDTWKKVFPDSITDASHLRWYQIKFTCNELQDGTVLLSFILPRPTREGQPAFATIRINLAEDKNRRAIYYVLRKPSRYDDPWSIFSLPITKETKELRLAYDREIEGTSSLRNLVLTVQQIPYFQKEQSGSFFGKALTALQTLLSSQEEDEHLSPRHGQRPQR